MLKLLGWSKVSHCLTGNAFGFGIFMGLWHHCVGPPLYGITLVHDYSICLLNFGMDINILMAVVIMFPLVGSLAGNLWLGKSARRGKES